MSIPEQRAGIQGTSQVSLRTMRHPFWAPVCQGSCFVSGFVTLGVGGGGRGRSAGRKLLGEMKRGDRCSCVGSVCTYGRGHAW